MTDDPKPVRFAPERYRIEAKRVRREADTGDPAVRDQLLEIARRFDLVADTLERAHTSAA